MHVCQIKVTNMRFRTLYLHAYSLCLLVWLQERVVTSHLCLLFPRQRGSLNVSEPGSSTCARHVPPCGGPATERPEVILTAGQTVFMKWQQNANHYEQGFAGYMDLGLAMSPNSSDFTTLAVVSDTNLYAQTHRSNFTVKVQLPDSPCEHCVVRARYQSHKPGESIFLQCADIQIVSSEDPTTRNRETHTDSGDSQLRYPKGKSVSYTVHTNRESQTYNEDTHLNYPNRGKIGSLQRALQFSAERNKKFENVHNSSSHNLYGFDFNPFEPNKTDYIAVNTTSGELTVLNTLYFGIDAINTDWTGDPSRLPSKFMVDGIISVDYPRGTSNILLHTTGSRDDPAAMLFIIGSTNGSLVQYSDIFRFSGGAINGMSWYTYGTSATFRIQPGEPDKGGWYFEAGMLDFGGLYEKRVVVPTSESLYVDFQWIETNVNNYRLVYALLGNEKEPELLNAKIYSFDLYNGNYIGHVELNVSRYTFMSVHSYPKSASLFAFSPGLWNDVGHAWSLVAIDLKTGDVTKHCDIAPKGIFQRYYGGSVHQGQTNEIGLLYHVLRVEDSEADMIVGVDPRTCAVRFSEPTNLRHAHSLQRVDQST